MKTGWNKMGLRNMMLAITMCLTNACLGQVITTYGIPTKGNVVADARYTNLDNLAAAVSDGAGNLYFSDAARNFIYKSAPDGSLSVVIGKGLTGYSPDGTLAVSAYINQPAGLAIGSDGCLYFAEFQNNCVRKITRDGILTTVAGTATSGYTGNGGKALAARLQGPTGIAFDRAGNLYISESENNCIRKVDMTSGIITLFAGNALGNGTGRGSYTGDGGKATAAGLNQPGAIAFDNAGNLLIVDCFNHCIRKVAATGIISTLAGTGEGGFNGDSGHGKEMKLNYPTGVACDASGNVYVSDFGNNKIRVISAGGVLTTTAGSGKTSLSGDGGPAIYAGIGKPTFVATDGAHKLFVGDRSNRRIRLIEQQPHTQNISENAAAVGSRITSGGASANGTPGMQ